MNKIISFCLWGNNPKYLVGMSKNIQLAKEIYPDWKVKIFVDATVPMGYKFEYEENENVEVIRKFDEIGDWKFSLRRFEAAENDDDIIILRDADSRLNYREKAAVDEWLQSDKDFHVMRDHPYHKFVILAGMCGFRNGVLKDIKKVVDNYSNVNYNYGEDYNFLLNCVYPMVKNNMFIHDDGVWSDRKNINHKFPIERGEGRELFIGQVFDENDNQIKEHIESLKQWLKNI